MTIEEVIIYAKEVAEEKYKEGFLCYANSENAENDKKNDECVKCAKEHEQLAEWLEELREYKAIEAEIKEQYHANVDIKELMKYFIETIFKGEKHEGFCILTNDDAKMWEKYRAIGTVEECREAREKQTAKKPIHDGLYACPNCHTIILQGAFELMGKYCKECEQALERSE